MRILIGILVVLALVITTTVPTMSHAMPDKSAKAAETQQAARDNDCHGHGAKTDEHKAVQNDKDGSDTCCDKDVCTCVGGACHNGLSKIFGNNGNSLASFSSDNRIFAFENQFVESALSKRLKRPPKA